jgi:hypothetical protein
MTPKTLRKERIQKFEKIVSVWIADSPAIEDVILDSTILEEEITKLSVLLADAAESRTERKTDIPGIEAAIFQDRPVVAADLPDKTEHSAIMAFESAFGITSSSWAGKWHSGKPEWTRLRKWVVETWKERPTCFDEYVAFKKGDGKYLGLMDVTQIARNPENFYTSWDVFVRETQAQATSPTIKSRNLND